MGATLGDWQAGNPAPERDNENRERFETGSVRDSRVGKGRYDLISPWVIRELAKHMEEGAARYGDRNWESGQPIMRYMDSAERHRTQFLLGETDADHPKPILHLRACLWNIHCALHTILMIEQGNLPAELDDRP